MPMRALTVDEVAAELGRTTSWLYANWKTLVAKEKMPPPLIEGGLLSWSPAQFYAWLDRKLPKEQRVAAAAFRAAFEAASAAPSGAAGGETERWRDHLRAKYAEAS